LIRITHPTEPSKVRLHSSAFGRLLGPLPKK
jgi:hypothetical protein